MKYKCTICGYVYDDAKEDIPFAQLPDTWQCPLCGAPKSAFEPLDTHQTSDSPQTLRVETRHAASPGDILDVQTEHAPSLPTSDLHKLSIGQMASLCSNLARGCEKQYMPREQALFNELADWFTSHTPAIPDPTVNAIAERLRQDLTNYQSLSKTAHDNSDRGAQRVCVWGEKVTRMLSVLVDRYRKEGDAMLQDTEIWVCSVCGFVYIGKSAPELCPVCKVPAWKFNKIDRRK